MKEPQRQQVRSLATAEEDRMPEAIIIYGKDS